MLFSAEVQVQNLAFTMISSWEKRGEPSKEGIDSGVVSEVSEQVQFREEAPAGSSSDSARTPRFQSVRVYYYCGLIPPAFLPSAHTLFLPLLSPFLIL